MLLQAANTADIMTHTGTYSTYAEGAEQCLGGWVGGAEKHKLTKVKHKPHSDFKV